MSDEHSTGAVHILMPDLHHDYQGLTLQAIHDQLCSRIRALPVKQTATATLMVEMCRREAMKDKATLRSGEPLMPVPKTK